MPTLRWDPTDAVTALEVLPRGDDHGTEHVFEVGRDGMRLEMTVWPFESVVRVRLFRDGLERPVTGAALFVRGPVRRDVDGDRESLVLEDAVVAPSRFSYAEAEHSFFDTERVPFGVTARVAVRPHLRLSFE